MLWSECGTGRGVGKRQRGLRGPWFDGAQSNGGYTLADSPSYGRTPPGQHCRGGGGGGLIGTSTHTASKILSLVKSDVANIFGHP